MVSVHEYRCPGKPETLDSPRPKLTGTFELPRGCRKLNLSPLKEEYLL